MGSGPLFPILKGTTRRAYSVVVKGKVVAFREGRKQNTSQQNKKKITREGGRAEKKGIAEDKVNKERKK